MGEAAERAMNVSEARRMLGLEAGAREDEVRAATGAPLL